MAPMLLEDSPVEEIITKSSEDPVSSQCLLYTKFSVFRRLVPLVADKNVTHLNAAFMPPSNLIIHEAISKFCSQGLHDLSPKAQWRNDVEDTRSLVGQYINSDPSSLAFTRDTTEAMGYFMHSLVIKPGDNVVILDCEHPNQAYGWLSLRKAGLEVRQVPTVTANEGKPMAANSETFLPFVDERTRAIGLSSIMFHNGQWNDIADVAATYRPRGIHVLADLTQQVGFADLDVQALGVSAAAFSLHKGFNCPTGIAVLYVNEDIIKKENPIPPIVSYGSVASTSEDFLVPPGPIAFHPTARRYEHANMSLIGAVAAKAFLRFYLEIMGAKCVQTYLYSLGDALLRECKRVGVGIVGPADHRQHAPHLYTLRLCNPAWDEHFKNNNVAVSAFRWGIRVSFGFYNNLDDIRRFIGVIESGIEAGIAIE